MKSLLRGETTRSSRDFKKSTTFLKNGLFLLDFFSSMSLHKQGAREPSGSLIPLNVPFPFSSTSSTYPKKWSAYECSFDPLGDARSRFDIRFYLVSILFIISDPEVIFSFPWDYLSTRLIRLDFVPWWPFYWFWQLDLFMNGKRVLRIGSNH